MIYTCTLNPSIDYIVGVDTLVVGGLNRAHYTSMYPGGKGINVSRVLKRLGTENTALGMIGGFTGQFIIDALNEEGIHHDFVSVSGNTRINVKLKSGEETEINGSSPDISDEQLEKLLKQISSLTADDVLVLAGSVPASVPGDFYVTMMRQANDRGAKVVVDTSGPALSELIAEKPFLIKPNHHELVELFETEIKSLDDVVLYGKKLVERGVENVIVSMAGDGAFLFNKDITLFANAPKGEVKNSVGAGDSMLAGFLSVYTKAKDVASAFRYSVATGSATAFSEDLCTKEYVEQLVEKIQVAHR